MSDTAKTLKDALDGMTFAMVGTEDKSGPGPIWKSRPLTTADAADDTLHFLVSAETDWVQALETSGSPTTVTYSDPGKNTYVALQGTATTTDDKTLINEVWSAPNGAWFDGKDDPNIRVLQVAVESGEFWDSAGGKIGGLVTVIKAAAGGDGGDRGPVLT